MKMAIESLTEEQISKVMGTMAPSVERAAEMAKFMRASPAFYEALRRMDPSSLSGFIVGIQAGWLLRENVGEVQ